MVRQPLSNTSHVSETGEPRHPSLGCLVRAAPLENYATLISHQDSQDPFQESRAAGQAGPNSRETQPTLFLVTGFAISSGVGFDFKLQGSLFKC